MPRSALRQSRRILWIGVGVFVLGIVWDGMWHSRNPEALETGWRILEAHGLLYAGRLVALVGGLWAFRGPDPAPVASWYGLAAGGALAQVIGSGWDAWAHAAGGEAALAHLLAQIGLLALLIGVIGTSIQAHRAEEPVL